MILHKQTYWPQIVMPLFFFFKDPTDKELITELRLILTATESIKYS